MCKIFCKSIHEQGTVLFALSGLQQKNMEAPMKGDLLSYKYMQKAFFYANRVIIDYNKHNQAYYIPFLAV